MKISFEESGLIIRRGKTDLKVLKFTRDIFQYTNEFVLKILLF